MKTLTLTITSMFILLLSLSFASALVVDADYDYLRKIPPFSKNMFFTDTHDIETMIISTKAFENFIIEFTVKTYHLCSCIPIHNRHIDIHKH